jgi:hypothetical protein
VNSSSSRTLTGQRRGGGRRRRRLIKGTTRLDPLVEGGDLSLMELQNSFKNCRFLFSKKEAKMCVDGKRPKSSRRAQQQQRRQRLRKKVLIFIEKSLRD